MYAVLGCRNLSDEVLVTTLALVEQTLNARPLVPASSDIADLEALTPNISCLADKCCFALLPERTIGITALVRAL